MLKAVETGIINSKTAMFLQPLASPMCHHIIYGTVHFHTEFYEDIFP